MSNFLKNGSISLNITV